MDFSTADLERSIGRLCIGWAHLEDDFFQLLNYLMGRIDGTAFEIMRNELDIRDALTLSKNIAVSKGGLAAPHIIRLCDFVNGTIRPERNRIIHDPIYVFGEGGYERVTYATKIIKQPKPLRIKVTEFTRVAPASVDQISELIKASQAYLSPIMLCLDEGEDGRDPTAEAISYLIEGSVAFDDRMARYKETTKSAD